MKRIVLIIMVCLTTVSLGSFAQDRKSKKTNKEEVTFDVPMTCESCKKKIEKNIPFEKGVSDMKVDLPNKTVMVQFNPNKTSKEKLQEAFASLGYEAKEHDDSVEYTTIVK